MIEPTPGRVLWYWPAQNDHIYFTPGQPLAAMVAGVDSARCVNLAVLDVNGYSTPRMGVTLVQEGDEPPAGESYATWMPYQIGQAKRSAT